jgi:hypothetical protein
MKTLLSTVCAVLMLDVVGSFAQAPPASDPWIRKSSKPGDFRAGRLPWNTFGVELPKDWQLVPGFSTSLVTVAEKTGGNQPTAAIIIEHILNPEVLEASDVDERLASFEVDWVRRRDPVGENFEQQVKEFEGRRFVMVQYGRRGLTGPDRVVVYVLPAGKVMYRLICIAPEKQMAEKYQAIFAHVAATFKPAAPGS